MKEKSIEWTLISRFFGIIVFFIIVYLMTFIAEGMNNPAFTMVAEFLTDQAALVLVIILVLLAGEIFSTVSFPINLFTILFNSIAGIFLVSFTINLLLLVDQLLNKQIFYYIAKITILIQILVFATILYTGWKKAIANVDEKSKKKFLSKVQFWKQHKKDLTK